MEWRSVHLLAGFVLGVVVGAGQYWLVGDVGLAVVTGVLWAAGLLLTLRVGRLYPSHATGETWRDKRWTGLSVGLITLAALVGVSPTLPVTGELRLGLGLLVLGAGFAGYVSGTLAEVERAET